jgi:hypothetical protein
MIGCKAESGNALEPGVAAATPYQFGYPVTGSGPNATTSQLAGSCTFWQLVADNPKKAEVGR